MIRRRGFILLLAYGLLGLMAFLTAALVSLRTDLSFVLPAGDSTPEVELLVERLKHGSDAGLVLIGLSGTEPPALEDFSLRFATALEDSGRFHFVANGRVRPPDPALQSLFDKRYLLNPPVAAEAFSTVALQQALQDSLDRLATPSSAAIKHSFPSDPTGRLLDLAAEWSQRGAAERPGIWLSADRSTALMMALSSAEAYDLAAQEATLAVIRETFDDLAAEQGLQLTSTGPSVFAAQTSSVIRGEMQILTISALVLVIALFYAAFRSFQVLVVVLLPIGFALCAATLTVQGLFGHVHGVTIAFGGTLIGVAVDYQIHLINHVKADATPRLALQKIWPTLRLGALTTIAAFLPMAVSDFPGLSQLGVFAAAGLTAAVLAARWLLPAVLPALPAKAPSQHWERLCLAPAKARWARAGLALLAVACLAFLMLRGAAVWQTDLQDLSPLPDELRQVDRQLRQQLGAADVRYLLFLRGDSEQAVLEQSEALTAELQNLVDSGQLSGFDMAAHTVPSIKAQEAQRATWPDAKTLRGRLDTASAGLPLQPALFEPFLEDFERNRTGAPVTLEDFQASGLGWQIENLLFQRGGHWFAVVLPRGVEDPQVLADFAAGQSSIPVGFFDLKSRTEALLADYRRQALGWLALGAVVAFIMLFIGLRSLGAVARVVSPVICAIIATMALISAFGFQLSIFHLLSLLLVGGIGLDFALFLDRIARFHDSRRLILRGIVLCAATSIIVFTVLAFSQIPVLHGIGMTVAVGVGLALLYAMIFSDFKQDPAKNFEC